MFDKLFCLTIKKRFVFDKDTNKWVDTENPDEETETPVLPPKSIFAGQPKVVQSVSRSPAGTRLSVRNKKVQSKTVCGHPQQSAPLFTPLAVSDLPDDENRKNVSKKRILTTYIVFQDLS